MRSSAFLLLAVLSADALNAQDPGQGAPAGLEQRFVNAFFRKNFSNLVALPALGNVRSFGPTGYVQEFREKGSSVNGAGEVSGGRFALVRSSSNIATDGEYDVYQIYPAVYSYLLSVGVANTGYPTDDTGTCLLPATQTGVVCTYNLFSNNYALFAFPTRLTGADSNQSYAIKDPMYTRWTALGGITGLGAPTSGELTLAGKTGTTAVGQTFGFGALYNITSGAATGKTYAVGGKIYSLYYEMGLHVGSLGLPTSDELQVSGGRFRQSFEGGAIEYSPTTDPVIRPAVGSVGLSIATSAVLRMNLGETQAIRATVLATTGESLADREVSWVTSNGRVVTVQSNGLAATLRAVGGGTALIQAVSDGKLSPALTVFVAAPCCQIGEGAPSTAIAQSFQDAVTRNRLNVKLPAANPVRRIGTGYVQELQNAENAGVRYLLCRSDRSPGVFLVAGELLRAYEVEGGPAGRLAYPTTDATASGRQVFEGGALAGAPAYAVTNPILARWGSAGFETGALGPPIAAEFRAQSFSGALGVGQVFRSAVIYAVQTGSYANRQFVVGGLIAARHSAFNGAGGPLGFPITEEYPSEGRQRQDFEGGALVYTPGDAEAELVEVERRPEVTVTPGRVTAGGRVRITVGGFPAGSAVQVSFAGVAGFAPFTVQTEIGSYTWETPIPSNTASGAVTITAREQGGEAQAVGTFTVTAQAEATLQLQKIRGDTQTGLPGAALLTPLRVALRDEQGQPVAGIAVRFTASPGSEVIESSGATDEQGEATARVRLQGSDGVVLVTAEAASRVVTFSARANGTTLASFPRQTQAGSFTLGSSPATVAQKGAMLAAVSSVLRYHQNRNELTATQGLAEPSTLNEFLKGFCVLDTAGGRICDGYVTAAGPGEPVVNLWRLRDFTANSVEAEILPGDDAVIRDNLAAGRPVLLTLALRSGDAEVGSHVVVAIGVSAEGGLVLHDPNPVLGRTRLSEYTGGFQAGGRSWRGEVLQAIRLTLRSPSPTAFLVSSNGAGIAVRSEAGECGAELRLPGAAAVTPTGVTGSATVTSNLYYCVGQQRDYVAQFEAAGAFQATITDLGNPGRLETISPGGAEAWAVSRESSQWQGSRLATRSRIQRVTNAATGTNALAAGTLAVISGFGLAKQGGGTRVWVGEQEARVAMLEEFRALVEIPLEAAPGRQEVEVESPYGAARMEVELAGAAPAIFEDERTKRGQVINASGGANSATNPVNRGGVVTVYATGLGSITERGNQRIVNERVTALIGGVEYGVQYAGQVETLPGVYIVNVGIPAEAAPGLAIRLRLKQGGVESNAVEIAIR